MNFLFEFSKDHFDGYILQYCNRLFKFIRIQCIISFSITDGLSNYTFQHNGSPAN